jgi:hypothetical protein
LGAVHPRQDAPERGIRGDHGAAGAKPFLGPFVAGEEIDLMKALLAQGQGSYDQQEEPGDGNLRSLSRFEERLGFQAQVELVGAETGEV